MLDPVDHSPLLEVSPGEVVDGSSAAEGLYILWALPLVVLPCPVEVSLQVCLLGGGPFSQHCPAVLLTHHKTLYSLLLTIFICLHELIFCLLIGSKGFPLTEKLLQSWGDTGSNEKSQHRPVLPVLQEHPTAYNHTHLPHRTPHKLIKTEKICNMIGLFLYHDLFCLSCQISIRSYFIVIIAVIE